MYLINRQQPLKSIAAKTATPVRCAATIDVMCVVGNRNAGVNDYHQTNLKDFICIS